MMSEQGQTQRPTYEYECCDNGAVLFDTASKIAMVAMEGEEQTILGRMLYEDLQFYMERNLVGKVRINITFENVDDEND